MACSEFEKRFANLVNAGFPYIYVPTYEEERLVNAIHNAARDNTLIRLPRKIYQWTQTMGFICDEKQIPDTVQPLAALDYIVRNDEQAIFLLKDFHVYFGAERNMRPDFAIIRRLRDILPTLKGNRKTVVFVSPQLTIPSDMEKEITILDFNLPDVAELEQMLDELTTGMDESSMRLNPEEKKEVVRTALGLTLQEAENAFSKAIVKNRGLDRSAIDVIHEEKNQVVKKTGVLEFVNSDLGIGDIGGLENLKNWLVKRNNSWLDRASLYRLPAPKGVLITGVPGCGKSLTAKAMSAIWGLPLLKLDMGRIFGGIVGSSEENMRKAINTAEAVAPSILWVDEIEKGFAGTKSEGDSGTSARVFGTFLTWMQDKTAPVFVIATSNDISALPPELLRKGRFDEMFFVDLPTCKEREKIFKVHIKKSIEGSTLEHEISTDDAALLNKLAELSEGFSGAEIEQVMISALYEAFFGDRGLRENDIVKAIRETVPLSVTQREQILSLRQWAENRAVLATAREDREVISKDASSNLSQGGRIVDFDL